MDLKLLRTFLVLSRTLHFGRTAEALHSTQPGVSQHIAKLEQQLGVALLTRHKKAVQLTPAGQAVARRAEQLLNDLDNLRQEAERIEAGGFGTLVLGLSSSAVFGEALQIIRQFKERNPGISVQVEVHPGNELIDLMNSGTIDVALTTLPATWEERRSSHVCFQEIGLAVPTWRGSPPSSPISLLTYADIPFIVVPRELHPELHDALVSHFANRGRSIRIAAYETPFPSVLARVAIGEGVGLIPLCLAASAPSEIQVCAVSDNPLPPFEIRAVIAEEGASPSAERFLTFMADNDQ